VEGKGVVCTATQIQDDKKKLYKNKSKHREIKQHSELGSHLEITAPV
jgi:hypothetical protein